MYVCPVCVFLHAYLFVYGSFLTYTCLYLCVWVRVCFTLCLCAPTSLWGHVWTYSYVASALAALRPISYTHLITWLTRYPIKHTLIHSLSALNLLFLSCSRSLSLIHSHSVVWHFSTSLTFPLLIRSEAKSLKLQLLIWELYIAFEKHLTGLVL